MPKDKTTPQYRAKTYSKEFKCLLSENETLICVPRNKHLSYSIRSHITQHLETRKHLENVEREKREGKQTSLMASSPSTLPKSKLTVDLCQAFVSANIPFKLKNPAFREFLFKYIFGIWSLVETAGTFYMLQACMQGNCL